jgi:hypothetical protein
VTTVTTLTNPAGAGSSPFTGEDICAIAGFSLPPGQRGPAFEQATWDFSQVTGLPAYLKKSHRRLEFAGIRNPAWQTVAKEYCAALLAPRHGPVRELPCAFRNPLTLQTCALKLAELTRWLNWLTSHGVTALGQVTDWHCDAYAAERSERRGSDGTVIGRQAPAMARAAETVIDLASYRELFSTERYPAGLRPFGGRAGTTVAGLTRTRNGENSAQPVPDDLLRPVLAAALYLVRTLAPGIRSLQQEARDYRAVGPRTREKYHDPSGSDIQAVLRRRVAEGRPLDRISPAKARERVSSGRLSQGDPLAEVSLDSLAREAGRGDFHWSWPDRLRPEILAAIEAVGIEEPYGRNAPAVTRADGNGEIPWTLPVPVHQISTLTRSLKTACVIVIAAVSGMRASEISELAVGCRRPVEEPVPGLARYRLASTVIKGQPHGGTSDEWVVTKDVFDAVEVAEQLAEDNEDGTLAIRPARLQPDVPVLPLLRERARRAAARAAADPRRSAYPANAQAHPCYRAGLPARRPARRENPAQARLGRDHRGLRESSGIASEGRETAGQLVGVGAESVQAPGGTGLLTCAGVLTLPLDA